MIRLIGVVALLLAGAAGGTAGTAPPASPASDDEVAKGRTLYAQCSACHSPAYHRTGPKHCNLNGRKAGSAPGFDYTEAMKNAGIVWGPQSLDRFLQDPLGTVPGTSMTVAGLKDPAQRAALVQYLLSLDAHHADCNGQADTGD
ncbi:cytochrome c family protein [Seongchinamella sediminis]|uniref:Cytochrome c family protein n=1 Tax=Seongchinamella sediminis TaxID=2283635 RepID=A0A3L7DSF2_9GAMM|nr:c-type cytochrome [Seongchinamella sediminis]RLQ20364.1 cytochrome c family protein [Seongchinamella sediminis]